MAKSDLKTAEGDGVEKAGVEVALGEEGFIENDGSGEALPAWEGSLSASEPIVAPDGHVVLSQEDIDARD